MASLRDGPMRFSRLRAKIGGISEKMLSQTLRVLVRDGLIERTVEPSSPPKVSYELTPLGCDLADPLQHLIHRIAARADDVVEANAASTTPDRRPRAVGGRKGRFHAKPPPTSGTGLPDFA
ncbi:helix-turn-helix domain-containing protein [Saccharopolyspora sp. NPDC050642]|uniref:winged helix-turn-helix transcriptional regulator n=1 Tax=Saccharopolyspora sp. NPDC050642 TaxID=3157099 RepID=UPI0033CDED69